MPKKLLRQRPILAEPLRSILKVSFFPFFPFLFTCNLFSASANNLLTFTTLQASVAPVAPVVFPCLPDLREELGLPPMPPACSPTPEPIKPGLKILFKPCFRATRFRLQDPQATQDTNDTHDIHDSQTPQTAQNPSVLMAPFLSPLSLLPKNRFKTMPRKVEFRPTSPQTAPKRSALAVIPSRPLLATTVLTSKPSLSSSALASVSESSDFWILSDSWAPRFSAVDHGTLGRPESAGIRNPRRRPESEH